MPVYRSAQGRQIDMTQLASMHEKVRAVGNMNVNARGDIIDSNNKVITDGTKRVKNTYTKTVSKDAPKQATATPTPATQRVVIEKPQEEEITELSVEEQELFDDNDEEIKK